MGPTQRLEKLAGTTAAQILDNPVVRQDRDLIVRKGDSEKSIGRLRSAVARRLQRLARPCRTGRPMVAVGDVQHGIAANAATSASRSRISRLATRCDWTPSGA